MHACVLPAKAGLADSRRPHEQQNGAGGAGVQLPHRHVLNDAPLHLVKTSMVGIQLCLAGPQTKASWRQWTGSQHTGE